MKIRSIKLPKDLDQGLYDRAQARGISGSAVLREALAEYLATPMDRSSAALSFGRLAADLAGCTDGPADLSTNPAHMDGYGRSRTSARKPRK